MELGDHAFHMAVLHLDLHHLGLMDGQAGGQLQSVLHPGVVFLSVGLDPQGVDRGTFAPVQHPALKGGGIRRQTHQAAQGVHLPHQGALGGAADAGVAGHVPHCVQAHGKDGGPGAQHRRGVGRLDAGMARANHNHIIVSKMVHSYPFWLSGSAGHLPTQNFSKTSSMTASEAFSPVSS